MDYREMEIFFLLFTQRRGKINSIRMCDKTFKSKIQKLLLGLLYGAFWMVRAQGGRACSFLSYMLFLYICSMYASSYSSLLALVLFLCH